MYLFLFFLKFILSIFGGNNCTIVCFNVSILGKYYIYMYYNVYQIKSLTHSPSSGVRCRPHYRLAISKIQQENFQNIARLWLIMFASPSTPALQRSQGLYTSNVIKCLRGLRPGEVLCGQGLTGPFHVCVVQRRMTKNELQRRVTKNELQRRSDPFMCRNYAVILLIRINELFSYPHTLKVVVVFFVLKTSSTLFAR